MLWASRVAALAREGAGVGHWAVERKDGEPAGEVPTAYQQLFESHVFWGREASHELGPLYQLWHFARPVLVIGHHAYAQEFNKNQLEHVRSKDYGTIGLVIERLIGSAIGPSWGKEFTRHKSHFKTEFGKPRADLRLPLVETHVRRLAARFPVAGADLRSFSVDDIGLNGLTLEVLSDVCYGPHFARAHYSEISEIKAVHDRVTAHMGEPSTCVPGYRYLPTRLNRAMSAYQARWARFNRKAWSQIEAGDDCVVGHLKQMEVAGALRLSECEVHQNLEEILLFNIDVIQSAVGSLMMDLARRPEWQARLRREIVGQVRGGLDRTMPLKGSDLGKLTEMDNFITESARLCPALSLTLPEELPYEMTIGGARVPRGTSVVIDCFTVNHDPSVFPEPDAFNPDRFRDTAGLRSKMFRFGMGPRKCMGQNYATNILKVLLVHVLSEQHLSIADPKDAMPPEARHVNSRGEELRYTTPCREVRTEGMAYFSPFVTFPRLRSVPLRRSPLQLPALASLDVVAAHWHRPSALDDAELRRELEKLPNVPKYNWALFTAGA